MPDLGIACQVGVPPGATFARWEMGGKTTLLYIVYTCEHQQCTVLETSSPHAMHEYKLCVSAQAGCSHSSCCNFRAAANKALHSGSTAALACVLTCKCRSHMAPCLAVAAIV